MKAPLAGRMPSIFKQSLPLWAFWLASSLAAFAQTTTTSTNFLVGTAIPDGDTVGLASFQTVATPIGSITGLKVTLKVSGAYNGDLYCYLTHSSGFSVLLNRPGRRASDSFGYNDPGVDVTFDDAAAHGDVHNYRLALNGSHLTPLGGGLSGIWAPDGRTNNPTTVLDSDAPAALLNSFTGVNPNGDWVLFVADLATGDTHTLDNWGLAITGYPAPVITTPPANQTAECSSGTATFSVAATGQGALSYQWRFGANPIFGATSSSFTTNNPTFASAGGYDVVVTGSSGSVTSSIANLVIVDTTPPTTACAPARAVECGSLWSFDAPTANDTCSSATITVLSTTTNTIGHCGSTYDATRTWRATDTAGNHSDCSQTIIAQDLSVPTIDCAPAKTVECGSLWSFDAPTASDTCGSATVAILITTTNTSGHWGNTFDATRTWRATDACGNTADCSQTITLVDTTAPVLSCASDEIIECGNPFNFTAPMATDACAGTNGTITIASTVTNSPNPRCQNVFSATRTWRATDLCGNTVDCSQKITIVDTTPPVITCAGPKTIECGIPWTFDTPTATDGCDLAPHITLLTQTTNTLAGHVLDATETWRATDACGNHADCSQTVTVVDSTPPVVTLSGNSIVTVECHSNFIDPGATASDTCAGNLAVSVSGSVNTTAPNTNTLTYSATDPSGNTGTTTRTIRVMDTTAPLINCSTNISLLTTNPPGAAASFTVTASDLCSGSLTPPCDPPSGSVFSVGTTTVNCMATDANNNSSSCSFTVTVVLNHPPVAGDDTLGALENHARRAPLGKFLGNDTDADGDTLTLTSVSASSTNGGTVLLTSTNIIYQPATNFVGADLFTYTVSDGRGGIATGNVFLHVYSPEDPSINRISEITLPASGGRIRFAGITGLTYMVQRSTQFAPPTWIDLGIFTVGDGGLADFPDPGAPPGSAYYRILLVE